MENLFSYYLYDMSEFMGSNPNSNGLYISKPALLDPYWQGDNHVPYFIYADDILAGFALIRRYPADQQIFDIDQFFVLRRFKGQGVGKRALQEILAKHPGKWQIRILKANKPALKFWCSSVSNTVGSNYEISMKIDVDLEMHFIHFET